MKESSVLLLTTVFSILISLTGCETGGNRSVTGEFFDRNSGKLGNASARVDSVVNFSAQFGTVSNALVGKYLNTSAFAVFKFTKPNSVIISNLKKARIKFTVYKTWSQGEREFALYAAHSAWEDTTRLKPDLFPDNLGEPIAVYADTASSITSLIFELNNAGLEHIKSWGTLGAFLLKNTDRGEGMANVYTNASNSPPILEVISHLTAGIDTTNIKGVGSAYYFDTGLESELRSARTGVLSDGGAKGFVLNISFPDSFARSNAVNMGKLTIPITRNLIPSDETMNLTAYVLTGAFTTVEEILKNGKFASEYQSTLTLTPADVKIQMDISGILGAWNSTKNSNYGIMFKLTKVSSTPSQVVVAAPETFDIIYTALPEVR